MPIFEFDGLVRKIDMNAGQLGGRGCWVALHRFVYVVYHIATRDSSADGQQELPEAL
jgi:hypothetical protein